MKKRCRLTSSYQGIVVLLVALLCATTVLGFDCTTPKDGERFQQDTLFCLGTYDLPNGISVANSSVLDCSGATLLGTSAGTGINAIGDSIEVRNCVIMGYGKGLIATGADFVESNIVFRNNGRDRVITTGETINVPPVQLENATPVVPPALPRPPTPVVTTNLTPAAPKPRPTLDAAPPEAVLRQALEFEYNSTDISEQLVAQRIAQLRQTLQDVTIEREFIYRNGQTSVRVRIVPKESFFRRVAFQNLTLYEHIPKCFAKLVDEVIFEGNRPVVLNDDPLMKKVVMNTNELEFNYRVKKAVSKECQQLFAAAALGTGRSVSSFSSVLAQKGIFEVVREFPVETGTTVVFLLLLALLGAVYKRQAHRMGDRR